MDGRGSGGTQMGQDAIDSSVRVTAGGRSTPFEWLVRRRVVAMVILTMTATSSGVAGADSNGTRRAASIGGDGGFVKDQVRRAVVVDWPTIDGHSTAAIERSLALIRARLPPGKLDGFNRGLRFLAELEFASKDAQALHELIEGECDRLTEYRQTPEAMRLSLSADAIIVLSRVMENTTDIGDFLDWEIEC